MKFDKYETEKFKKHSESFVINGIIEKSAFVIE